MRRDYLMRKFVKSSKLGISLPGYTDNRPDPWSILPMRKVQQTDGLGIGLGRLTQTIPSLVICECKI